MDYQAFLIKYAEIGIKGKNRYIFEDKLVSRINTALKRIPGDFAVSKNSGRIYAVASEPFDRAEAEAELQTVFGRTPCGCRRLFRQGASRFCRQFQGRRDPCGQELSLGFPDDQL